MNGTQLFAEDGFQAGRLNLADPHKLLAFSLYVFHRVGQRGPPVDEIKQEATRR